MTRPYLSTDIGIGSLGAVAMTVDEMGREVGSHQNNADDDVLTIFMKVNRLKDCLCVECPGGGGKWDPRSRTYGSRRKRLS